MTVFQKVQGSLKENFLFKRKPQSDLKPAKPADEREEKKGDRRIYWQACEFWVTEKGDRRAYAGSSEPESPLDVGGETTTTAGDTFERTIYVMDSFGSGLSVSVDYGEGSPESSSNLYQGEYYPQWWAFDLSHTYEYEGSYTVTVSVENSIGDQSSASFQVDVEPPSPPARAYSMSVRTSAQAIL
jgi:hypothetical protein